MYLQRMKKVKFAPVRILIPFLGPSRYFAPLQFSDLIRSFFSYDVRVNIFLYVELYVWLYKVYVVWDAHELIKIFCSCYTIVHKKSN